MTELPVTPVARHATPATSRGLEPERLAGILARAWLEVLCGRRALAQLAPLVAPAVRRRLAAQLPTITERRGDAGARVRRVVARWPTAAACEATVLVEQAGRTTALAIRLEQHRGAWRAVELTAPEAGLPPLPTASLPVNHQPRDAFDDVLEPMWA